MVSCQDQQQEKMSDCTDLESQLRVVRQELEQREVDHHEEVEKVKDDLDCLQNELIARKEVIDVANETIVLKVCLLGFISQIVSMQKICGSLMTYD